MKFADKLDYVMNIIYIVICVVCVVLIALCCGGGEMLFGEANDAANSIPKDGNSPGAGYLAAGGMAFAAFSGLAGALAYVLAFFIGIITVILVVAVVSALSRRKKYKLTGDISFISRNLTTKIIYNTVCLILYIAVLIGEPGVVEGILVVIFAILEILFIVAKSKLKIVV